MCVRVCMYVCRTTQRTITFPKPADSTYTHKHSTTCTKHLTKLLAQHIYIRKKNTQNNINLAISNENIVS